MGRIGRLEFHISLVKFADNFALVRQYGLIQQITPLERRLTAPFLRGFVSSRDREDRDQGTEAKRPRDEERGMGHVEGDAGESEVGAGAEGAAIPEGANAAEAEGGLVAGDANGCGISGGADCGDDEVFAENGVSDGARGTEEEDQPGASGADGTGARMRSGVWAGSVAAVAGGSGDGTGGAGVVEEEVYDAASRIRGQQTGSGEARLAGAGRGKSAFGIRFPEGCIGC
jgi:hypothetical protein